MRAGGSFTAESAILRFVTPLHSDTALLLCELEERAVNTSNQKILRRQGFRSGSFHTSFPGWVVIMFVVKWTRRSRHEATDLLDGAW